MAWEGVNLRTQQEHNKLRLELGSPGGWDTVFGDGGVRSYGMGWDGLGQFYLLALHRLAWCWCWVLSLAHYIVFFPYGASALSHMVFSDRMIFRWHIPLSSLATEVFVH
jgi:hypothetical protein